MGAVRQSYNNMRIIVSCGWAIYPAGYFLGQVNTTAGAAEALNVTYNIADFVNKIAFVLACWSCAKSDSSYSDEWSTLQIKSQGAKAEAAEKLIGNHIRVTNDICNPSPVSQGNLARVSANNMGDVERMLLEVARRLSGNAGGRREFRRRFAAPPRRTWPSARNRQIVNAMAHRTKAARQT